MIEPTPEDDYIARQTVDAAFAVHRALGPGLLESVYDQCPSLELTSRGLSVQNQILVPVFYRNGRMDVGFRLDILVNDSVIVEVKVVEKTLTIHEAQLLTYLRLSGYRLGLLINFNVLLIKDGIRRMIRPSDLAFLASWR